MRKILRALIALFTLLLSFNVYAQEDPQPNFDIRNFHATPSMHGAFSVEQSKTSEHLSFDVKLTTDYANTTLVDSRTNTPIIKHLLTTNLSASLAIMDRFELGIAFPFVPYQAYDYNPMNYKRAFMGDTQLQFKATILHRENYHGFGLAAGLKFRIPTGHTKSFLGDGFLTTIPYFIADYNYKIFTIALNLGFSLRKYSYFYNFTQTHTFDPSLAINIEAIKDQLDVIGEIWTSIPMSVAASKAHHIPAEWLAGLKYKTPINLNLAAAAGTGFSKGIKNPKFRVLFAIEYTYTGKDTDNDTIQDKDDKCVTIPGTPEFNGCPNPDPDNDNWCSPWVAENNLQNNFNCKPTDLCPEILGTDEYWGCTTPDTDNDKICDPWVTELNLHEKYKDLCTSSDECPTLAGVPDFNGCPNPDTDKDKWCDPWVNQPQLAQKYNCKMTDLCPQLPATSDEFQGCPNPDADKDGICAPFLEELGLQDNFLCQGKDLCPDEPEDLDNFQDEDGCPDFDNDHDSLCDPWVASSPNPQQYKCTLQDKCPNEPGLPEHNGCPDSKMRKLVIIHQDKLELTEKIFFDTNKATIKPKSFPLLNQVALDINSHPEFKLVTVEGHTDDTGKLTRNMTLSQERAESVVNYLVKRNVAPERLKAIGYGPTQPLDPQKTKKARAINRRVEFKITQ